MPVTINASTSSGLISSADTSGALQLQSNGTTQFTVDSTGAYGQLKSGTAVASTSGTSIDFTGIPSWVKRVTVMFNGVSTNSTSQVQIQLGSTTFSTSGYSSTASYGGGIGQLAFATTGFITDPTAAALAAIARSGLYQFTLIGSNNWVGSGNFGTGINGQVTLACAGNSPTLGGALDRLRITTVNGTDTFDSGSINILYEG
jgi:hypothetical protein